MRVLGGAQSGAESIPIALPAAMPERDPLLAVLVNRWPRLTAEQRLAIVEIAAQANADLLEVSRGDADGS